MKTQFFKKSILFLSFLFLVGFVMGQAPEKMSYQSVIRGTNNALITNQNVRVKISILQGTITGSAVYVEDHTTSTNSNGLVSLSIGGGNVISGSFSTINWENGPYFVKMEADPTGGTNYTVSGTSQLLSVPYALYAKSAGSSQDAWNSTGNAGTNPTTNFIGTTDAKDLVFKTNNSERMQLTSAGNVGIGTNSPSRALDVVGTLNPLRLKSTSDGCYIELYTTGYTNSVSRAGWMGYSNISSTSIGIWNQTPNGKINFGTNNSQRMTIDSVGNVGIGTLTPTDKLMMRSNDGLSLGFKVVENVNYAEIQTNKSGGSNLILQKTGGYVGIGLTTPISTLGIRDDASVYPAFGIYDNLNNPRLMIDYESNGTSPITNIQFNPITLSDTAQAAIRFFRTTNTTGKKFVVFLRGNSSTEESARIGIDGQNSFFQIHGGNLGIGTNAPNEKLEVNGSAIIDNGTGTIRFHSNSTANYIQSGLSLTNGSSKDLFFGSIYGSGSNFTIKSNGNIGVGTTTPTAKLDVAGTVKIADGTQGAGKVLTSDASGNATWQSSSAGRTVRGTSSGGFAPTVINGSGFTVTRTSSGTYSVTFSTPFTTVPTVTSSVYLNNSAYTSEMQIVKVSGVTVNGFTIHTLNYTGGTLMNLIDYMPFAFIASGN
jgi:hypothetical protein